MFACRQGHIYLELSTVDIQFRESHCFKKTAHFNSSCLGKLMSLEEASKGSYLSEKGN